jgi:hypothetical protein
MSVLISFTYEKNGEQVETVHSTANNDFTRDELLIKFQSFMESLGYVFPEDESECSGACPGCCTPPPPANFDLE